MYSSICKKSLVVTLCVLVLCLADQQSFVNAVAQRAGSGARRSQSAGQGRVGRQRHEEGGETSSPTSGEIEVYDHCNVVILIP